MTMLLDARANGNFFGKSFRYQLKFIIHCVESRAQYFMCVLSGRFSIQIAHLQMH